MKIPNSHKTLLAIVAAVFIWSLIAPKDYFTWFLEVFPVIIGVAVLIPTYQKFRLTTLVYTLMTIHAIILMVGGHYTYAEMPLFSWLRDTFDLGRNHYDRLGHFAQGFVPAMIARELILRKTPLKSGSWLFFLIVCIAMAISAAYELLEWVISISTGEAADAFLGTQGDIWDTQKDMALATVGSIFAQLSLSKVHDRQLESVSHQ